MKTFSKVLIVGLLALLALTSVSFAAVLPNATPETQGITSQTVVECTGIVISSANYANEHTTQMLDGAPLDTAEVYGASAYNSQMVALNGQTSMVKTVNMNTKDQVLNGKNIDVVTDVLFEGADGGFVTGDESIAQFNAGQSGIKTEALCPFEDEDSTVPPFNEAVVMGSRYDMYYGKIASSAGATTTAATADVASQTGYIVEATGAGSISAGMSLFAQDARGTGVDLISPAKTIKSVIPGYTTTIKTYDKCGHVIKTETKCVKDQTITTKVPAVYTPVTPSAVTSYKDSTSAMGQFTFSKTYGYTSGIVG